MKVEPMLPRICKKYRDDWDDLLVGKIYYLRKLKNITTISSKDISGLYIIRNEDVDEYFYTEKEIRKLKLEKICQKKK